MPHKDPEIRKIYHKNYSEKNSAKAVARMRLWRKNNRERDQAHREKYQKSEACKRSREKCKNTKRAAGRRYYATNKLKWKKYAEAHRERINAARAKRKQSDENYRLGCTLRRRISRALRSKMERKTKSSLKLLGCSIQELKLDMQSKFKKGMSWENRAEWHIDHIIPCAFFDLSDFQQQRDCFNYRNLRPLWAAENFSKNANVPAISEAHFYTWMTAAAA